MKARGFAQKVTERLGLRSEALPGITVVELSCNDRLLIENYKGVICFGPECVKVEASFGVLTICGDCLALDYLEKDRILVLGKIRDIHIGKAE